MPKPTVPSIRFPFCLPVILLLCLAQPAWANGLGGFLMVLGLIGLVAMIPLTLAIAWFENRIVAAYLKISPNRFLRFIVFANFLSLAVGFPVRYAIGLSWGSLYPTDFFESFHFHPYIYLFEIALFFTLTVIVELVAAINRHLKRPFGLSMGRFLRALVLANIASYALLGPFYYFVSRPDLGQIRGFTRDAAWYDGPKDAIVCIDAETSCLIRIDPRGGEREVLVPYRMTSFILSEDLQTCVFRNYGGSVFYHRQGESDPTLLTDDTGHLGSYDEGEHYTNQMALSPSSGKVAFYERFRDHHTSHLIVHDVSSGQRVDLGYEHQIYGLSSGVAWSESEDVLYAKRNRDRDPSTNHKPSGPKVILTQFDISGFPSFASEVLEATDNVTFAPVYGRFGSPIESRYYLTGFSLDYRVDSCGPYRVETNHGLKSRIGVLKDGDRFLSFSDNPGIVGFSVRVLTDVSLLSDCRHFLFESRNELFLCDIEQRKIGRVAKVHSYILLTDRYQKSRHFFRQFWGWDED